MKTGVLLLSILFLGGCAVVPLPLRYGPAPVATAAADVDVQAVPRGLDETSVAIGALREGVANIKWTMDRELGIRTGRVVIAPR